MFTLFSRHITDHNPHGKGSINYRFVLFTMGVLCLIQVPFLLIAFLVSAYYGMDAGAYPVGVTGMLMLAVGGVMCFIGRHSFHYDAGTREGLLSISLSWFVISSLGMLPLYIGHFVPSIYDAFFDTIAGITTTGASVITDVESLPRSILFWRSMLQWEGGLGILVFLIAFLPLAGQHTSVMLNQEPTGATFERFVPKVKDMLYWIIGIYVSLTLICALLLWMAPMTLFDAVCHAATCVSTGGLSTKNDSIGFFHSSYVNTILAIFMIIGATSFRLIYIATIGKQPKRLFQDIEFRWFISIIVIFTIAGALWLYFKDYFNNPFTALGRSAFTIISTITSTSYFDGDYSLWGSFFGLLVLIAMFISGCSGSTAGGLKVVRFQMLVVSLNNEIRKRTHPNAVLPYRIGSHIIKERSVQSAMTFFFAYLCLILVVTLSITTEGYNFIDSLSAALSCASNAGQGLGFFGPTQGFELLSPLNKVTLSILMIMGRLEIFTVLSLFHSSFWRS